MRPQRNDDPLSEASHLGCLLYRSTAAAYGWPRVERVAYHLRSCDVRRSLSLLLATSLFGLTGPGQAFKPPGSAVSAPTNSIVDHVRAGDRARLVGRWADGVAAYRAALTVANVARLSEEKRAPILGELGVCEEALGQHRDAAERLDKALEHLHALSREQRWRFEQAQRKAESQIGILHISVDPPDAEVLVDGKSLGASQPSYQVFVEPGRHTIRARLAEHARRAAFRAALSPTAEDDASPSRAEGGSSMHLHNSR